MYLRVDTAFMVSTSLQCVNDVDTSLRPPNSTGSANGSARTVCSRLDVIGMRGRSSAHIQTFKRVPPKIRRFHPLPPGHRATDEQEGTGWGRATGTSPKTREGMAARIKAAFRMKRRADLGDAVRGASKPAADTRGTQLPKSKRRLRQDLLLFRFRAGTWLIERKRAEHRFGLVLHLLLHLHEHVLRLLDVARHHPLHHRRLHVHEL